MTYLLLAPFLLQGGFILFDEFFFHHKRGLPAWERWGHPLDTLTVLLPVGFLLLAQPSIQNLILYVALAAFSCIFITKDEFVHTELCGKGEQWLHANLFLLHPMVFFSAGFLWWRGEMLWALGLEAILLAVFFHYQLIYWGIYAKPVRK